MENVSVNHLLYMDDLKLQARSNKEIESLVNTVRIFSDDVHMQFGQDKCAKVTINRGKLASTENIRLPSREEIRELEIEETYKYLGIHQADEVKNNVVKEKTQSEYKKRLRMILKSKLSGFNQITAINIYASPIIAYTAGIVDWNKEELRQIDTMTRKQMTLHCALHPRADVDRLYVSTKKGGRGLRSIAYVVALEKPSLAEYVEIANEPILRKLKDEEMVKYENPLQEKK